MTLTDLYIISVAYYCGNDSGDMWTEQVFLGVEGKNRLFVFDKKPCGRTKVFWGKYEAELYMDELIQHNGICFENPMIIPLEDVIA